MSKICVDIDELMDKLKAMSEDDYVTVQLNINEEGFSNVLELDAVGLEDGNVSYGELDEVLGEI